MLQLSILGRPLLLAPGQRASIEHVNPLFADGIEDSYSLPLELPVQGNEETLGHVHEMALRERHLVLGPAELGTQGTDLFPGLLQVLATNLRLVRSSFTVQGLAQLLDGQRLRTALADARVDLLQEVEDGITFGMRKTYADGGNCQFPLFLAPALYGEENPDWNPDAPDWSATATYALDDLVLFTDTDIVERKRVWQCIEPGGAGAGESPKTHPAKWRLGAFALANAWNVATEEHYQNTVDGNYYAMVPWFYTKWVITQALASLGLRATGTFMVDPNTHEELLPNLTTLDRAFTRDGDYFFSVEHSAAQALPQTGLNDLLIECDTETPLPLRDPAGLWDGKYFIPAVAGSYRFHVRVRYDRKATGSAWARCWFIEETSFTAKAVVQVFMQPDFSATHEYLFSVAAYFGPGDVGNKFRFFADQRSPLAGNTWGYEKGDTYLSARITGWLETLDGIIAPDDVISPARHVPDVEVGEFLVALMDAYCLECVPDLVAGTVALNYKQDVLVNRHREATEASHRLITDPEIDHQRTVAGMRLQWDMDTVDDPNNTLRSVDHYYSEEDLPIPFTTGLRCVVRCNRKVYQSVFLPATGVVVWREQGRYVPAETIGEEEDAVEVQPKCRPVDMTQVWLDGRTYQVPVLEGKGTSAWYGTRDTQETIYLASYHPMRDHADTSGQVPGARSWGVVWDEEDASKLSYLWDQDLGSPGMLQYFWQLWADMLVAAEPVTADLLVDLPFLLGRSRNRILHMHGQDYLVERLPMEHGGETDRPISEGAYLYRLVP